MKKQQKEHEGAKVLTLEPGKRRRAPRRGRGPTVFATSGSAALAPQAAPKARPTPLPTPSRWFSEKHGAIGFRLYDILYVFAKARRALPVDDALEWGARYFAGALSEAHAHNVLGVLTPGEDPTELAPGELPEAIRQAFRDCIVQGAGRLLQRPHLAPEQISEADATRLVQLLEELYEQNRWLLPALPFGLHLLLRRVDMD